MGAEVSMPVGETSARTENNEKPSSKISEQNCEAFEVVKLRSGTLATESGSTSEESSYALSPPQHHYFQSPPQLRTCDSTSTFESCQSPIPRSPDSIPSPKNLTVAVEKARIALERSRAPPMESIQIQPTPPPPPPPGPPPQCQCGEFLPFMEIAESVTEYFDASTKTLDNPFENWWETSNDELVEKDAPILTQRDLLLEEAASLELGGDLSAALECYKECLSMGKTRLDTAQVHHKMGVLHWKIGNYNDALCVLQKSMKLYQDAFGFFEDHDEEEQGEHGEWVVDDASKKAQVLADVLNSLARVHLSLGLEASRDLKQALALVKLAHDQSSSEDEAHQEALALTLARTKFGLGMAHESKSKLHKAKKFYREALEIYRAHDSQIDIAACLNSIGAIQEQAGDYDDAMDCYTEALVIYRAQLVEGMCSPVDVAVTLNNIGFIHHLWGEFQCSMTAFEDALDILESVLGPKHRNVASTRHNIGLVNAERGKYKEALDIFKPVLQVQLETLGESHTDVAITLDSISNACEHLEQLDRAIQCLERSLVIREQALGRTHILVAVTLDRLGKLEMKQGDLCSAKQRFHDALSIYLANNVSSEDGRIQHIKAYLAQIEKQEWGGSEEDRIDNITDEQQLISSVVEQ